MAGHSFVRDGVCEITALSIWKQWLSDFFCVF
jgi:hypothetical protein